MSLGNWGQSLLKDAAGGLFGSDYLRDYTHASKTFRSNSYAYAPKLKFLFHVYFDINPQAYAKYKDENYGLLVREVKLPSFTFTTQTLNEYNRKRIVQTKIKYDPISIVMHDDNSNVSVMRMWNNYYLYYYRDGSKPNGYAKGGPSSPGFDPTSTNNPVGQGKSAVSYSPRTVYTKVPEGSLDWGYIGQSSDPKAPERLIPNLRKPPFFNSIVVYGFNQHSYVSYTLINPIIVNFAHDTYNYDEGGGTMRNSLTIDYETVVYNTGSYSDALPDSVPGFADVANYDKTLSPISVVGANETILGQGGLIDAGQNIFRNLTSDNFNPLGAIVTAGKAYNTFKNTNLKATAATELQGILRNAITNIPANRNTRVATLTKAATPGPEGTAGAPPVGAQATPAAQGGPPPAGRQGG